MESGTRPSGLRGSCRRAGWSTRPRARLVLARRPHAAPRALRLALRRLELRLADVLEAPIDLGEPGGDHRLVGARAVRQEYVRQRPVVSILPLTVVLEADDLA